MALTLGIDTSNYTTSAALFDENTGAVHNCGRLLSVTAGEKGLRQSDAVFLHIKNLPEILTETLAGYDQPISAIGVSSRPRNVDGSYMPCFLAGVATATGIAQALRVPLYRVSHQDNHVVAAAYQAKRPELLGHPFLAWHLSGGTSELVLVEPDKDAVVRCRRIGGTNDLAAGQLIDRIGVQLGLDFPCGKALDVLARSVLACKVPKPTVRGLEMSLSGLENKGKQMIATGATPAEVARFTLEAVCAAVEAVTENALSAYSGYPVLCAGGVMSNSIIKAAMQERFGAVFAPPAFSTDNAAGTAILASMLLRRS